MSEQVSVDKELLQKLIDAALLADGESYNISCDQDYCYHNHGREVSGDILYDLYLAATDLKEFIKGSSNMG